MHKLFTHESIFVVKQHPKFNRKQKPILTLWETNIFVDLESYYKKKTDICLYSDIFYFFNDKQFSTSHNSSVAIILAYDMLIIHLKKEIDKLKTLMVRKKQFTSFENIKIVLKHLVIY